MLGRLAHREALKVQVRAMMLEDLSCPPDIVGGVVAAALRDVREADEA